MNQSDGARAKVRGLPKSWGFILWEPRLYVPHSMSTHPMVSEICQCSQMSCHVVLVQFFLQTEQSYQDLTVDVFGFCRVFVNHHKLLIKRFQTIYKACFNLPKCHLHFFHTVTAKHSDHRQHGSWLVSAASSQQGSFVWAWGLHVVAEFVPVSYHTNRCCTFHASHVSQTLKVSYDLNHGTERQNIPHSACDADRPHVLRWDKKWDKGFIDIQHT